MCIHTYLVTSTSCISSTFHAVQVRGMFSIIQSNEISNYILDINWHRSKAFIPRKEKVEQ